MGLDCEFGEQRNPLERPSNTETGALKGSHCAKVNRPQKQRPRGRLELTTDAVHQCALASAIWTYEPDDLTGMHVEVDLIKCGNPSKPHREGSNHQDGSAFRHHRFLET
jgi:hypothetical protein